MLKGSAFLIMPLVILTNNSCSLKSLKPLIKVENSNIIFKTTINEQKVLDIIFRKNKIAIN